MLETPRKRKVSDSTDRKRRTKQPRVSITMASSIEHVQADNSIMDEDDEGLPAIPFLPRVLRTEQRNTNSAASSQPTNRTVVNLSDSEPLTEEPSIIVTNETSNQIFALICTLRMIVCHVQLGKHLGGWLVLEVFNINVLLILLISQL